MKLDELLLDSGNDVPFEAAGVTIHVPTLKEIAYIGEKSFLMGCHFLLFDKNNLEIEDKSGLENQSNFNIFMSVMNSSDRAIHKTDAMMVLTLLFPNYKVEIEHDKILLQLENFSSSINEYNFEDFKKVIAQIFCLDSSESEEFNPSDALAKRIAEKIKKGREARNKTKDSENVKMNIYSRYISILSVGLPLDKNLLYNYTVYQLKDEFDRFQMKMNSDIYLKAKLAGAQDLEEVENWMEDIHS